MKNDKKYLLLAIIFFALFLTLTALVLHVDVRPLGAMETEIGLSHVNLAVREHLKFNEALYTLTDILGIIPLLFALGFAFLGLFQCIKRKSIFKVDKGISLLGAFYFVVIFTFVFFEIFVVNYRPVLISGELEASYPSSTTLLVGTIIPTTIIQLNIRIKSRKLKAFTSFTLSIFALFMTVARLFSGVHWLSDIIAAVFISTALVFLYCFFINKIPDGI